MINIYYTKERMHEIIIGGLFKNVKYYENNKIYWDYRRKFSFMYCGGFIYTVQ
jgi:hypothetical protein